MRYYCSVIGALLLRGTFSVAVGLSLYARLISWSPVVTRLVFASAAVALRRLQLQ